MTTHSPTENTGEVELFAFLTKLDAWARQLSLTERAFLEALLSRAATAAGADVEGFMMRAQPYEPGLRPVPSPEGGPAGYGGGGGSLLSAVAPLIGDTLLNGSTSLTLPACGG